VSQFSKTAQRCFFFVLVLLLAGLSAWGQAGTSTIRGTVTDPQGKLISGATVTINNPSTNYSRTMRTTDAGTFSFELIPPGSYQVEVEAQGFKKKVLASVPALVGTPTDRDVQMELGSPTELVRVEAAGNTVQVNTVDATLGNNFTTLQLTQLPLEARNVLDLLTLQPGVTRQGYVAGARSDQSNITLDGVDINEAQTNDLGSPVLRLNAEAVEEFRVNTVNSNANQGRSSAAQVNLVTKSGTNQFHGALFEEHRNTIFTANDFFNNRSGLPRPALIRNTFGGAVGGPVMKNKLFFFYSYEGRRDASATAVGPRTVPLPTMGQGIFRALTTTGAVNMTLAQLNQVFPVSTTIDPSGFLQMNPAAIAALADAAKKYPANDFTTGDSFKDSSGNIVLMNTAGFRFNAATPVKLNSNVARLDWNINSKQTAFFRFNAIYDSSVSAPFFPDTPAPTNWSHPYGFVAGHTWTIGSNWVNNARYGLTRQAFSQLGDSADPSISFRFIFSPRNFSRTISRTTPVHNIVDDISWVRGTHTIQFGTNIRLISNTRVNFAGSFDSAITNPSGYQGAGNVVSTPISNYLTSQGMTLANNWVVPTRNAVTALIGRFSGYNANLIYGPDLKLQPVGTPSLRDYATRGYDFYIQDSWKVSRNLTLSYGLRYGLSQPVYETHGFEVQPNIPLGLYFQSRLDAGLMGTNYNVPVSVDLSGPANGKAPMYNWDYKNFQPRAAFAWSPNRDSGIWRTLFGTGDKGVIRGGFAVISDYYGEALAAFFDGVNTLGFSGSSQIPVNTYNVSTAPAPLFTGYNQNIRSLPNLAVPGTISFPQQKGTNLNRIESSLDSHLVTPKEYTWNLTVERELMAGVHVQLAYIGRMGRHLLAQRDVMAMNDLVDPVSKTDWYTNAAKLEAIRQTLPPGGTAVTTMPYFDNVFPSNLASLMSSFYGVTIPSNFTPTQTIFWIMNNLYRNNDWTDVQADLDTQRIGAGQQPLFFQSQYGALNVWSTVANSNYHGFTVSVRQRYRKNLTWDFNYTYSHSLDDASGLQSVGSYNGQAFIENPVRQRQSYARSGFDIRHLINVNAIYQLPFGRGQWIGHNMNRGLDMLFGGWQLSGIWRWNTGLPVGTPSDSGAWATNFQLTALTSMVQQVQPCVSRQTVQFFACNNTFAFQNFRNAYPGETGARNVFTLPGYVNLDAGLFKAFKLDWAHLGENANLQLRWEVFNVTNTQHFAGLSNYSKAAPTSLNATPTPNFATFTSIQGNPRVMQVGLRLEF
jgi:hypothetical protein